MAGVVSLAFFANYEYAEQHTLWIGRFAIVFFLFASPKLIFTICSIIGRPFNRWLHWSRKPFVATGLVLATLNAALILYGSMVGKDRFEVKEVTFRSPRLPEAFNGYRIVQLSDIHIGSWQGNAKSLQRMVDLVNAQKPDLIVFTGDLVNNRAAELDGFEEILSQLHATDGVYSILGNHDYGPYYRWKSKRDQVNNLNDLKKRQADMGWILLNNEHTLLHRGNDSIALIGVENEGEPPFSQHGDLTKAQAGTNGLFKLLLSHNPTHWRREVLPQSDIDLMLAGHTHAMQLAIGHHSPASWIYPEWGGMYMEDNRGLYVNVGMGFVGLPFRFGAWPEITVITLDK
ncbi:metallophosphoesterase [Bacteroides fragilis]